MSEDRNESLVQMMAAVVRLSQLLNVTLEDATTIYLKILAAMGGPKPH